MKTYVWGSGGTAARINLSTGWRWMVSFTPRSLYPPYPLDRRLEGPQSRSEHGGKEKNSLLLPGIELQSSSP